MDDELQKMVETKIGRAREENEEIVTSDIFLLFLGAEEGDAFAHPISIALIRIFRFMVILTFFRVP